MGTLNSNFSKQDIDTLIEAVDDWEMIGNFEYHQVQYVKNIILPPEDHESYEIIKHVKDTFQKREKEIKQMRAVRQERAVLMKAKLMLLRQDMAINKLMEFSPGLEENPEETVEAKTDKNVLDLKKAEDFIRDLGVWAHYESFLEENKTSSEENSQAEP